jgi:predicted HicB family RNase H-like nuclease
MPETVVHVQIRMPPHLHEHLASRAQEEKTSLNAIIVAILRDAEGRHEAAGTKSLPVATPAG